MIVVLRFFFWSAVVVSDTHLELKFQMHSLRVSIDITDFVISQLGLTHQRDEYRELLELSLLLLRGSSGSYVCHPPCMLHGKTTVCIEHLLVQKCWLQTNKAMQNPGNICIKPWFLSRLPAAESAGTTPV